MNLTRNKSTSRAGFTLLELLLVLVLIGMISSLVVPQLTEVFERQKLNGSANELRLKWDRARLEAMRTGQAQLFECEVGTGSYIIKPLLLQSDITNAGAGATVMTGAGTLIETQANSLMNSTAAAAPAEQAESQELEEKITFVSCQVASDMRAYDVAQESQTMGGADLTTLTIGHRVIFYPDGSTSTAEVQIKNERGDVRAVRIRGLTGHSRVVDISNVASSTEESSK